MLIQQLFPENVAKLMCEPQRRTILEFLNWAREQDINLIDQVGRNHVRLDENGFEHLLDLYQGINRAELNCEMREMRRVGEDVEHVSPGILQRFRAGFHRIGQLFGRIG